MTASSLISVPVPNAAETLANATYEALMWALARPGTVQALPQADMAAVAATLLDRECRVHAPDAGLAAVVAAAGAALVPAADADHAFLDLGAEAGLRALATVPAGSRLYPEEGATVFSPARIGTGQALRLTGPGIETGLEIRIGGLHPSLWMLRASRCAYPLGFELFLVDGARVVGLPRSTGIEVL